MVGRYAHPLENMPDYGREMADQVGIASLILQLDYTRSEGTSQIQIDSEAALPAQFPDLETTLDYFRLRLGFRGCDGGLGGRLRCRDYRRSVLRNR